MQPLKLILSVPDGTTWDQIQSGEVKPAPTYVPISVVKNNCNAKYFDAAGEANDGVSLTIPNQAMTVRELLARFASGLPVNSGKVPIYEGDTSDEPDIDRMDQIERHDYYMELKKQKDEATDRIIKARQKAEELKMEKVIKERVEKRKEDEDRKAFEEFKKSQSKTNNNEEK